MLLPAKQPYKTICTACKDNSTSSGGGHGEGQRGRFCLSRRFLGVWGAEEEHNFSLLPTVLATLAPCEIVASSAHPQGRAARISSSVFVHRGRINQATTNYNELMEK